MRTEREIREKIDELMDEVSRLKSKTTYSKSTTIYYASLIENRYCMIDALLWAICDRSGKEI